MLDSSAFSLINLLFDPGENICVSPNQYGYVAIDPEKLRQESVFLTQNDGLRSREYATDTLSMLCVNPVNGARKDENVSRFRNFLVEIDGMPLADQIPYVESMKMPYSAVVFSGNKSLHFAISLDEPLESLDGYKFYGKWILNVMNKADPNTFNPTRSIRMPGATRIETGQVQHLVKLGQRVSRQSLIAWLEGYSEYKPELEETKQRVFLTEPGSVLAMPEWVQRALIEGPRIVGGSRNKTWFGLACELGKYGYDEDDAIAFLETVFEPESDFGRNEWKTTVRSGVKHARK